MAIKSLFKSLVGRLLPQADMRNEAGGTAPARVASVAIYARRRVRRGP